jgi:hypothetical protein
VIDYTGPEIATFWIFKTADGTAHWRQQYQGTLEGAGRGSGSSYIHFFDALNGYAYAGTRATARLMVEEAGHSSSPRAAITAGRLSRLQVRLWDGRSTSVTARGAFCQPLTAG